MAIGESNDQMHFSIPKMPDFLDDNKVEMVLTEESKQYFERARSKQGFVGIVELCPDEVTSSGKKLAKIHLIPADNKESGALAGIDKEGKKLPTLSSLQRLGTFTGDLHMRAAGALGLGEKGGVNGMLMGFGIWKSGCGIKFLDYLPPREALIPNEYLLVKEDGKWNLYFTEINAKFSPEASPRLISDMPGLQDALDRLPSEKSLYSLTYEERLEIETILRNTEEGKKEKEEEIGVIKNRSSSQNMYSINREARNAQLYKVFYDMGVSSHGAHLIQYARELPFFVLDKIIKNTTQQLPGVIPIRGLVDAGNNSMTDAGNGVKPLSKTIMGDINGSRYHLELEQEWMKITPKKRRVTLMFKAITSNRHEILEHLIKSLNVSLNLNKLRYIDDGQGVTFLTLAAGLGHKEVCLALIEAGADPNAKDSSDKTALMRAAENGHKEVCLALIEAGADVNPKSGYGRTPLMIATENGHKEVCLALIEAGADVNAKDSYGGTPLMIAVRSEHEEVSLALIKAGADVNVRDEYRGTPLMIAANKGHKEVCIALIRAGASYDDETLKKMQEFNHQALNEAIDKAKEVKGKTFLMIAAEKGDKKGCLALIRKGEDVNAEDGSGRTALMIAVESGLSVEGVRSFREKWAKEKKAAKVCIELIRAGATYDDGTVEKMRKLNSWDLDSEIAKHEVSRKPALTQKFDRDRAKSPSPSSELPTSPKPSPRRK